MLATKNYGSAREVCPPFQRVGVGAILDAVLSGIARVMNVSQ